MFYFTPMEAKYTHLDNLIPGYHQFDNNYNHEYVDASKII